MFEYSQFQQNGSASSSIMPPILTNITEPTIVNNMLVNYEVAPQTSVLNVTANCDRSFRGMETSDLNEKFNVYCKVGFLSGRMNDADGKPIILADILGITAYTFQDCLTACSSYTLFANKWSTSQSCQSVTFLTAMAEKFEEHKANCWLKNGTVSVLPGNGGCPSCISAVKAN
jgi:hypothetical protein